MADERHYIVSLTGADGFDGTTPATLTDPWLPLPANKPDQKYRSLILEDAVGLFGPDVLGGPIKGIRLVRVFTDSIEAGDRYWTVGSATDVAADGLVEADPVSAVREAAVTLTTRPSGARPLELVTTDQLAIFTNSATTAHIIVVDLDEDETYDWTAKLAEQAAAAAASCCTMSELTVTETEALPATAGHLVVSANCVIDSTFTLAALDETTVGQDSVTITRTAGAGAIRIVTEDASDTVNGRTGAIATEYYLSFIGASVTYFRVSGGWVRTPFGFQAYEELTSALNPITLTTFKQGTVHVVDNGSVLDNQGTLPTLATVDEGGAVLAINTDTQRHQWVPTTGDRLNDVVNGARFVQPGQAVLIEASPRSWMAVGGGNQGHVLTSAAADINLTSAQVRSGITTIVMEGAASQNLNLPPAAECENGAMVAVLNNTAAAAHDLVPNGTDLIDGVNASIPDAAGDRTLLINLGEARGWMSLRSA